MGLSVLGIMAGYNKSLAHLPKLKQDEVELIVLYVKKLHKEKVRICKEKAEHFVLEK